MKQTPAAREDSDEQPPVINEYDGSGGRMESADPEFQLSYEYQREDNTLYIRPAMPYLARLAAGGPVSGLHYWWSPFQWQFPKLSIKTANNTRKTLLLTEAVFRVNESTIDIDPVLIVHENFWNVGKISLINEGWGQVIDPEFRFAVRHVDTYAVEFPSDYSAVNTTRVEPFHQSQAIDITKFVPGELRQERLVAVYGDLVYSTETGSRRQLRLKTRVSLVMPGPALPAPPNYLYDVFLEAGKSGYEKLVPISQEIKAGETDHFLIRVGTDKSCHFDLTLAFRTADRTTMSGPNVSLDLFVPRSQARAIRPLSG